MSIERDPTIRFHEKGTLDAVTRWIANHPDGISEWLKNVRRQYQVDRADVSPDDRVAVVLFQDSIVGIPARIGVLDVGGATLEDVTAWGDRWNDPTASRRGSSLEEEQTQGNGGKAYMYRMFTGPTRILGVRDMRRNCRGFEGEPETEERGRPGWIPNVASGREVEISSLPAELQDALKPYNLTLNDLPQSVGRAITRRKAFTLVEGQCPVSLYKGQIESEDWIAKVSRHPQATLCLEQVEFYVFHNGRILNEGKRLHLPSITPYPGISSPVIHEVPVQLPLDNNEMVSTTENSTREPGRLLLHTSADNMPNAYKNLAPRWQIIYRTQHQMIGAKPVSEIVGTAPGAQYVYGTLELPSLEPAYVEHGRRHPKPGPLIEAVDRFIAEKVKELAQQINAKRQVRLDERALDEVQEENRKLDELKNRFLPNEGDGNGGRGNTGNGPGNKRIIIRQIKWGSVPNEIELSAPENGLDIGRGLQVPLREMLEVVVRDQNGYPVRSSIDWLSSDPHIGAISPDGILFAKNKGDCEVSLRVKGTEIQSQKIPIRVWNIDHVLLTPRNVDVALGSRQQITAEVTDDDGRRSTNVILDWRHDAEDRLLVLVSRRGIVTGNHLGRSGVTAGAGDIWVRIPTEVNVIPNPEKLNRGSGFPRLLLTGRDIDPATGLTREGDPDQPPIWQEASDFIHNVWWLNLQSPEAAFAFRQRSTNSMLWRTYHAERIIEMVVQVWMSEDYTRKGESQREEYWASHLAAMERHRVRLAHQMWKRLEPYVSEAIISPADEEANE